MNPSRLLKTPCSLLLVLIALPGPALAAPPAEIHPLKPADTSSPRATLRSFIDNMNGYYRLIEKKRTSENASLRGVLRSRIVHCLDVSKIDPAVAGDVGWERAVLLSEILDRIELPPFDKIPDAVAVAKDKNGKGMERWTIPDTALVIEEVKEGPRKGEYLFSPTTVQRIPEFHDLVNHLKYKPGTVLPNAFRKLFTTAPPPKVESPIKPADTSSPQTTLKSFVDNMNAIYRSFKETGFSDQGRRQRRDCTQRVMRCLDLSQFAPGLVDFLGPRSAVLLMEVLDRTDLPAYEQIPGPSEVAKDGIRSWRVPNTPLVIIRIEKGDRQGEYVFSADTLERLPSLYERAEPMPYKQGVVLEDAYRQYLNAPGPMIPESLVHSLPDWMWSSYLEEPAWKWLGAFAVLLLLFVFLWLAFRLGGRRREDGSPAPVWRRMLCPLLGLFLPQLVQFLITHEIRLVGSGQIFISNCLMVLKYLSAAWVIALLSQAIANLIISSPRINKQSIDAHMVRIVFRLLSLAALVVLVLRATEQLGIPLTPVLAGLGISGVAIALAAQNSIENLIGGFNLFVDRPVRVGDFCKFGTRVGTVEEIGLRSTRVRTLDRTLVSVPNSVFSRQEIENFARRDRILFHHIIKLHLETTPSQLRYVLAEIKKMLTDHAKVHPDPARVRLVDLAESAVELEVFAYVLETDFSDYLKVAEELNLSILEIIERAGTSLAVPGRRNYSEGLNADKAKEIEDIVRHWQDDGKEEGARQEEKV